jgi:hypothetical protein
LIDMDIPTYEYSHLFRLCLEIREATM